MAFRYDKLLGRIAEKFGTQERFAEAMNMSPQTLSLKLNNKSDWKREEMIKACELLEIDVRKIKDYFFTVGIKKS